MATRSRKRHRRWSVRQTVGAICLAACIVASGVGLVVYGPGLAGAALAYANPDQGALRAALADPTMTDLRSGYAARRFRPIWIEHGHARPEAAEFVARLAASNEDGLEPELYQTQKLTRLIAALQGATRAERMRTELALSRAFADYVADLHTPSPGADMIYTDADLAPTRPATWTVMDELAKAPSVRKAIDQATQMNPLYLQYRKALGDYRAGAGVDTATERLLLINLERVRALPVDPGPRFVLVDAAAGLLWLYEDGRRVDSMKVIVGKPDEPTPIMAGIIRYAMFNPYWNVPPDITRDSFAPRIAANLSAIEALRMDVWSDYTPQAHRLDPASVDWQKVAYGAKAVWLRQRPGPQNSMGAVKFMLPNELGIYLHDTPNKALFEQTQRTLSAGCVRVEDYKRLARWLYRGANVGPKTAAAEQRIDLPIPVPVYITYLTAAPEGAGVVVRRDVYGRDPALLAQLGTGHRRTNTAGDQPAQDLHLRRLTPTSSM